MTNNSTDVPMELMAQLMRLGIEPGQVVGLGNNQMAVNVNGTQAAAIYSALGVPIPNEIAEAAQSEEASLPEWIRNLGEGEAEQVVKESVAPLYEGIVGMMRSILRTDHDVVDRLPAWDDLTEDQQVEFCFRSGTACTLMVGALLETLFSDDTDEDNEENET